MTDDDGRHDSSGKKVLIYFADAHKLPDFSWHNIPKQEKKFLFISLMLTSAARYLLAQHTKTGRMYQTATK
jgi:hypothetical protein